ncbi:MAG: hypothetical protein Aurels2KO_12750 [Aureliella sp.]
MVTLANGSSAMNIRMRPILFASTLLAKSHEQSASSEQVEMANHMALAHFSSSLSAKMLVSGGHPFSKTIET